MEHPVKERRSGAGILAYSVGKHGNVHFLVQQTLSGRKQGQMMDLGGAVNAQETPEEGAQREWWEEGGRWLVPSREQLRDYFVASQTWRGLRVERKKRGWTLFFVRIPRFCLGPANRAPVAEGSKRREYFWVTPEQLLAALRSDEQPPETAEEGCLPRVAWQRLRKKRGAIRKAVKTICEREEALARID